MKISRIRELRQKMKITQDELAERVHISRSALANYEAGFREPKGELLVKIANTLKTSADYLLFNIDDPRPVKEIHKHKDSFQQPPMFQNETKYRKDIYLKDACINQIQDLAKELPLEALQEIESYVGYMRFKYKRID